MPVPLVLLMGLTGVTTLGTSAFTTRATLANQNMQTPVLGPMKLTTWEILAGVGVAAFLGPIGMAVGTGLAVGSLISIHDTQVVRDGVAQFAATFAKQQGALPGPTPVSPTEPTPAAEQSAWQRLISAPGRVLDSLWNSARTPDPALTTP